MTILLRRRRIALLKIKMCLNDQVMTQNFKLSCKIVCIFIKYSTVFKDQEQSSGTKDMNQLSLTISIYFSNEKIVEELLSSAALPPPFPDKWHAMEHFLFDFPHLEEFAPSFTDNDSGQFYRIKSRHVPVYLFHWFPKTSCNTWIRCQFTSRGQPDWQHVQDVDILNNLHRQK